jgi:hypothetical protein
VGRLTSLVPATNKYKYLGTLTFARHCKQPRHDSVLPGAHRFARRAYQSIRCVLVVSPFLRRRRAAFARSPVFARIRVAAKLCGLGSPARQVLACIRAGQVRKRCTGAVLPPWTASGRHVDRRRVRRSYIRRAEVLCGCCCFCRPAPSPSLAVCHRLRSVLRLRARSRKVDVVGGDGAAGGPPTERPWGAAWYCTSRSTTGCSTTSRKRPRTRTGQAPAAAVAQPRCRPSTACRRPRARWTTRRPSVFALKRTSECACSAARRKSACAREQRPFLSRPAGVRAQLLVGSELTPWRVRHTAASCTFGGVA